MQFSSHRARRRFKSSIPTAAIINLVSYNYTTYYKQYEQMTFGIFPHQGVRGTHFGNVLL